METPYGAPLELNRSAEGVITTPRQYGGIKRLPYLAIVMALVAVNSVLMATVAAASSSAGSALLIALGLLGLVLVYFRLKNIGMNPWLFLLMLVPILNLLVAFRCLAFQEGYADTRKLDLTGKVIAVAVVGLFLLFIAFVAVLLMIEMANTP